MTGKPANRMQRTRMPRRCPVCRDPFIGSVDARGWVECPDCGPVPATREAIIADTRARLDARGHQDAASA